MDLLKKKNNLLLLLQLDDTVNQHQKQKKKTKSLSSPMKERLILFLILCLLNIYLVFSQSVPIQVIRTSKAGDRLTQKPSIYFNRSKGATPDVTIRLNARIRYQSILGFGGAFTEAGAYVLSTMNSDKQREILEAYFKPDTGLNYTMGRVHMNSCDFSLNTYSCDDVENDWELKHFNVRRDEKYLLPFIKAALNVTRFYNPNKSLKLYLSPWSPPAWMKGNHNMNGSSIPGLIDDPLVYKSWALFYTKFIKAYKEHGVDFWGMTIQNESEFAAPWEACVYSPEQQKNFLKNYLGPIMRREHPRVKIMIFDHNRDHVRMWAKDILSDPDAAQYVSGTAFHWYTAGFYEELTEAHKIAPDKFLLATEACHCPGVILNNWDRGQAYGFDIINDLNNYAVGWVDWNMVLDMRGGPNHLSNFCDAPIIADSQTQTVHYQVMYYVMGHFSKYILPNSVRIDLGLDDSRIKKGELIATAMITPASKIVVIVENISDKDYNVRFDDVIYAMNANTVVPARSISTFVYDSPI
jgi:glucosylceramidase